MDVALRKLTVLEAMQRPHQRVNKVSRETVRTARSTCSEAQSTALHGCLLNIPGEQVMSLKFRRGEFNLVLMMTPLNIWPFPCGNDELPAGWICLPGLKTLD